MSPIWENVQGFLARARPRPTSGQAVEASTESKPDEYFLRIFKDDSKKERKHKVKRSFERNNVVMKVSKEDIALEDEAAIIDSDSDLEDGSLVLPRSGQQSSTVPNCCVICLEPYRPGDQVVWSSNPECNHAFHRSCMVRYLVRIQTKVATTPCCVCRCKFTDLEVEKRQRHRGRPRGGRPTVRTAHNFNALSAPAWWPNFSRGSRSRA